MANILIVEDEPLIAMMLEDFVEMLDHSCTANADTVAEAQRAIKAGAFDFAILDVNLRDGETSWPIADALDDAGIPFVFASGGQLDTPPGRHRHRPFLYKPFTLDSVGEACAKALET
ncbi:MAG: response regulator [Parasphingopyxis sp.]|nr:response regulator [Sphingomonadales bacterium]